VLLGDVLPSSVRAAVAPDVRTDLHRGLRSGEACGLRDADLDLDTGVATICQQITTVDYRPITKT
jgi:hypothetical protein